MIDPFRFHSRVRVRNYEIDWQGIVHNANYLLYFEVGRIEYLEHLGLAIDINTIQQESRIVVARNEIDYRAAARFGDTLDVATRIAWMRNSSFAFEAIMHDVSSDLRIAENRSVHVWLDYRTERPVRIPDDFRARVTAFERENIMIFPSENDS